jgi:hypothetical protein
MSAEYRHAPRRPGGESEVPARVLLRLRKQFPELPGDVIEQAVSGTQVDHGVQADLGPDSEAGVRAHHLSRARVRAEPAPRPLRDHRRPACA